MSRRNAANNANNRIRGPQSALTEFLAAQGISAADISSDYQRRQREAEEAAAAAEAAEAAEANKENESDDGDEDPVEKRKRKRKEEKALSKIKQSKEFKKRKFEEQRDNGSDADDDDTIARNMMAKNKPLPGQLENCEICEKRFTVTPYSKAGPDGGLLCVKCSKELKDEEKKSQQAAKKKPPQRGRKRQTESDRMMGDVKPGAKSLVDACVRKVASVVHDVEDFGDMPETLLDRLSQILSKKRIMTPRVLNLFLRDDVDHIDVYDCAKLETEDFGRIFAHMPHLKSVNFRFAGQMKDEALLYMTDKCNELRELQLGAVNLVTDTTWINFFHARGSQLESLKISEVQEMFSDKIMLEVVQHCPNLRRLKLRSCSYLTSVSIAALSHLAQLEHLTIAVAQHDTTPDHLINLIRNLGGNLKTLCLEGYDYEPESPADEENEDQEEENVHNSILEEIHSSCSQLRKFRITGNSHCTDRAFAKMFIRWANCPLTNVDFSDNRWIDNNDPLGPTDDPVGFSSEAFKAMMHHSGAHIQQMNLHSCRHISHEALLEVFDGGKQYAELRNIDLSFVTHVDDVIMSGIFKSCPNLTKLVAFACFNARGAEIPPGVAVVGLPNATDNIVIQGFMDDLVAKAMA